MARSYAHLALTIKWIGGRNKGLFDRKVFSFTSRSADGLDRATACHAESAFLELAIRGRAFPEPDGSGAWVIKEIRWIPERQVAWGVFGRVGSKVA